MKKLYILVFFIFYLSSLNAQEKSYTLSDAFQLARARSEVLADQQEQVIQSEEHYKQALGASFPTISGAFSYSSQHLIAGSGEFTDQTSIKLTATQPLFRGFRIVNAIKQNKSVIQSQKEAADWAAYQIYSDMP
ncbi:MAG: hypothetical protein DKM50_13225 [Candidatus Margulisiibacteriota bacterium]|nr:MAG: hypothetical protein A2X43_13910 [Candidatus Margulisbacteria bacterium GWD2_39_127]PZM77363.1 MAG: hypothetical protein DKM50_13225 [Candidatus Margulisiibacteriota bacterium]HAR63127.1 hypothetical protein [Candidatus Margulisiibacteriota bacterium]HCT86187.1 hypothetical protein [Candidatus Margulisiibacteriota bacterium]